MKIRTIIMGAYLAFSLNLLWASRVSFEGSFDEYLPQAKNIFIGKVIKTETKFSKAESYTDYVYNSQIKEILKGNLRVSAEPELYYRFRYTKPDPNSIMKSRIYKGCGLALDLESGKEYIFMVREVENKGASEIVWVEPVESKQMVLEKLKTARE